MKPSVRVAVFAALLAPGACALAQSGVAMTCTPSEASQHGSLQMQSKSFTVDFSTPRVTRSDDSAPVRDLAISEAEMKFNDFVAGVGDVHWQIDRHTGAFHAGITLIPANVRADPTFLGQCSGVISTPAAVTAPAPPTSSGSRSPAAM